VRLCECGCGGEVGLYKGTDKRLGAEKGQPTRFIHGHNKSIEPRICFFDLCSCGCGQLHPSFDKKGRPMRFIYGHNNRGTHFSVEHKRKISEAEKGKCNHTPYSRRRMRESRLKQIFPIKDTKIEVLMQNELSERGYNFETHAIVLIGNGHIRPYQCDILFPNEKVVVECDGNYWHDYPQHRKIDAERTKILQKDGYLVLRYWGSEIKSDVVGCVDEIEGCIGMGLVG